MENFFDFMRAALPWIAMGLLLAVFFANEARRKRNKNKKEDYVSEGMAIGMCLGVALGTALHIDIGLGLMAGLVLGLLVGSGCEKKTDESGPGTEDEEDGQS